MQNFLQFTYNRETEVARWRERVKEYEDVIDSFEGANENLRMRRKYASPDIVDHCDRHLALNSQTVEVLRRGLDTAQQMLKQVGG